MKHFRIMAGHWPKVTHPPTQRIAETVAATRVALLGQDCPNLRPKFELSEGTRVEAGQPLFHDRKRPEIVYVAPISGRIAAMSYGPRRRLSTCEIVADPDAPEQRAGSTPDGSTDEAVRAALLARGFWPAFRTRPFGVTPDPQDRPAAIFVNAVQGSVAAPDPGVVLADHGEAFHTGVSVLKHLTDGPIFVSQSPGQPVCTDIEGVEVVAFGGSPAAALVGTQIDLMFPVRPDRRVWSIGYQDVVAIGYLFETGSYRSERVIALSGPGVAMPRLVRAPLGIALAALNAAGNGPIQITSGGHGLARPSLFLGRFDDQVAFLPGAKHPPNLRWFSSTFAGTNAVVPTAAIEGALGPNILPVPLIRALSVGDGEAAQRLGCLALIEEDVALLTQICVSGADYGVLLRQVLDDLMRDAA